MKAFTLGFTDSHKRKIRRFNEFHKKLPAYFSAKGTPINVHLIRCLAKQKSTIERPKADKVNGRYTRLGP